MKMLQIFLTKPWYYEPYVALDIIIFYAQITS